MAGPLRAYSSNVPEFDTYPASPEDAMGRSRLPQASEEVNLDAVAREIGETLGRAVARVIDAKEEVFDRVDHATYRLRREVVETTDRYVDLAKEKIADARYRARHLSATATRDYPVHVILGAAAAGLLIGAGLRAWRENRG
jgi:hypothetical protein